MGPALISSVLLLICILGTKDLVEAQRKSSGSVGINRSGVSGTVSVQKGSTTYTGSGSFNWDRSKSLSVGVDHNRGPNSFNLNLNRNIAPGGSSTSISGGYNRNLGGGATLSVGGAYGGSRNWGVGANINIPLGRRRRSLDTSCGDCISVTTMGTSELMGYNVDPSERDLFAAVVRLRKTSTDLHSAYFTFDVVRVLRQLHDSLPVSAGDTLMITTSLASCRCLPDLEQEHYVVSGRRGKDGIVQLSNELIKLPSH